MSAGFFQDLQERLIARHVPLHALFEVTERCNYACTHCYLPHRGDDELTTAEAKRVLDELAAAGTMFLTLSGGEVFLRRDFPEIAEHAKAREFVLRIFTNGWFVDDRKADWLAALDPMGVEISLYGPDAATFETVTKVPGSFERTTAAIRRLTSRGVRVRAKTPVMNVNARRIPETETLAFSLGADEFSWDPLVAPMDGGESAPLALRPSTEDLAFVFAWDRAKRGTSATPDAKPLDAAPCNAGRGAVSISPRGDVFPCVAIKVPAGNLRTQPFSTIWSRGEILERMRGITVGTLRACATCEDRPWCPRCAGMAKHEEGDLEAPNLEACRIAAARRAVEEGRPVPAEVPSRPGLRSLRILG